MKKDIRGQAGTTAAPDIPEGKNMKKLTELFLVLALILCAAFAAAEPKAIDGVTPREIEVKPAGLNPSAEEMIAMDISPTTGRKLSGIQVPESFAGAAVTGKYTPFMVQISNANNGVGTVAGGLYAPAPVNGSYADVVYEACQRKGGAETRMSMIFSDTIPDYVGFVRSTRATHPRIRQEWNAFFCTSGYTKADVPDEWRSLGVKNPMSKNRNEKDPGVVYVGDAGENKPWKKYVRRLRGIKDANSEVFLLKDLLENVVPKDHVPANHTWKFTDELPTEGDNASIVYVTFGSQYDSDSRLEYDPDDNVYIRYMSVKKSVDMPYRETTLIGAENVDDKLSDGRIARRVAYEDRVPGNTITFSNVIVQGITMKWRGGARPDPVLTGRGNADYFMGGKHIAGVWEREDYDHRTVFYGPDGNEIEMQRGRTLIILMGYNNSGTGVSYE